MSEASPSLLTRVYYVAKPFLPRSVRWAVRRHRAVAIRRRHSAVWPIDPSVAATPAGWPGWPEGKRAALVLTHDVEGSEGVEKVRALAELEMRCGFRSCFNFIPEGEYRVPDTLREWLIGNGFEVGVHDLNHDGKLYLSRERFGPKASRINRYLQDWQATGFRSGFMLRELDWLHDLNIDYDCSTFDTDPFEPQPAGAHTIFPYWIARRGSTTGEGYVELPYTLPQDSTLFLLLRETDAGIWLRKSDWLVQHGGMILVNVHPDYIDFEGGGDEMSFPASHYEALLRHVAEHHGHEIWPALPKAVSRFVTQYLHQVSEPPGKWPLKLAQGEGGGVRIWIDLENTPHIPFFAPIVRELRNNGHRVMLTARDGYQTCELAGFHGLNFQKIGRHFGKSLLAKIWGLLVRGCQLTAFALQEKPQLAINLGSRTQNLAAKWLRIPVAEIMDYEHTAEFSFLESRWCFMPEVVRAEVDARASSERILTYRGLKEDVYVPGFVPDSAILDLLGLREAGVVVTVRPAATEAHYHNPESEELLVHLMERARHTPGVKIVLLPRNKRQETALRSTHPDWFEDGNVVVPPTVVDGLNLIWHSDLVVSGGGTMNREAAAMGVPVYSIFLGRLGAVDRHLCEEKRLVRITSTSDVDRKIRLEPRPGREFSSSPSSPALDDILGQLRGIIASLPSNAPAPVTGVSKIPANTPP
jgi:predicted glycosyltransferase